MTSRFLGSADRALIEDRLLRLVRINSVNPGIEGGPGESDLAIEIEGLLRGLSLRTQRQAVDGRGRDNILGRLQGAAKAPVVLFEAHLDTVGLSGTATTEARSEGGVVYGRGACDTKGSIVAMLETLRLLEGTDVSLRPTVVFVGTIDEEYAGTGAATLVGKPTDFDMAIVGEPTELHVATAHKGVLRFEIAAHGVPAHSSKPHLGVNAITAMGPVLTRIQEDYLPTLDRVLHPLVGSPTFNVSTIHGGTAQNVVPAECVIWVDRRVNPGESHQEILADIDRLLETLGDGGATIERRPPTLATAPLDTSSDHPLVSALTQAREQITGNPGQVVGMTFGTDASFISPAGIPCVVFGPGSIDQAHSDDEWVEIEQVAQAAEIMAEAMLALV